MNAEDVGQLILMGIPGTNIDNETANIIRKVKPGGIILFGRNIESPNQLRNLIDDIRSLSSIEPIITIDQEGGRVSRLRLIGNEPPSASELAKKDDIKLIERHGTLTGEILRLFGFNLNLCPVLDVSGNNDLVNSLNGRCYGETITDVITRASAFNHAMRYEGILSCAKHFPGYTFAECDAHEKLPTVDRTREQWENYECAPFNAMLPDIDSVMICHTHYPFFENNSEETIPASLSYNVITKTLRNQLSFDHGLVMTDDLDMGAILNEFGFEQTIKMAVKAGNDLIMICHRTEMAIKASEILQELPEIELFDSIHRIKKIKEKLAFPKEFCLEKLEEIDNLIWQLRVDTLGEELAKNKSIENAKRSPVEDY